VDLKFFFFNSVYQWAGALDFPNALSLHAFIDCLFSF
jgi:hypothetical protein